jgi:RNA polymerase sigma-70 factor (ECF subfamily)
MSEDVGAPSPSTEQPWDLIEQYRAELRAQAFAILGNREDAEDVVQETYCEAFRQREKLLQTGSIGAWLRSVNRCNALDRLRIKLRTGRKTAVGDGSEMPFTTGGFSVLEARDMVTKALEALPADTAEMVRLRFFQHLSFKQIAEKLKRPESTVKWQLIQGLMQLYDKLKVNLESPDSSPRHGRNTEGAHPNTDDEPTQGFSKGVGGVGGLGAGETGSKS